MIQISVDGMTCTSCATDLHIAVIGSGGGAMAAALKAAELARGSR